MISNRILQSTIEGLKGITRMNFCICDTEGRCLHLLFEAEEYENSILAFVDSPANGQVIQGYQFSRYLTKTSWVHPAGKESNEDVCIV